MVDDLLDLAARDHPLNLLLGESPARAAVLILQRDPAAAVFVHQRVPAQIPAGIRAVARLICGLRLRAPDAVRGDARRPLQRLDLLRAVSVAVVSLRRSAARTAARGTGGASRRLLLQCIALLILPLCFVELFLPLLVRNPVALGLIPVLVFAAPLVEALVIRAVRPVGLIVQPLPPVAQRVPVLAVFVAAQVPDHLILLHHPVALVVIGLPRLTVELRHDLIELLQVRVVLLLAHALRIR